MLIPGGSYFTARRRARPTPLPGRKDLRAVAKPSLVRCPGNGKGVHVAPPPLTRCGWGTTGTVERVLVRTAARGWDKTGAVPVRTEADQIPGGALGTLGAASNMHRHKTLNKIGREARKQWTFADVSNELQDLDSRVVDICTPARGMSERSPKTSIDARESGYDEPQNV